MNVNTIFIQADNIRTSIKLFRIASKEYIEDKNNHQRILDIPANDRFGYLLRRLSLSYQLVTFMSAFLDNSEIYIVSKYIEPFFPNYQVTIDEHKNYIYVTQKEK